MSEKPEIKIGIFGGNSGIRQHIIKAIISIRGNTKFVCCDDSDGSILSNIKSLEKSPLDKFNAPFRFCDCLNCRLGKVEQCQTFNPSRKGKRK